MEEAVTRARASALRMGQPAAYFQSIKSREKEEGRSFFLNLAM